MIIHPYQSHIIVAISISKYLVKNIVILHCVHLRNTVQRQTVLCKMFICAHKGINKAWNKLSSVQTYSSVCRQLFVKHTFCLQTSGLSLSDLIIHHGVLELWGGQADAADA